MKRTLILTVAAVAIMGMGTSRLHAETVGENFLYMYGQMPGQDEYTFGNAQTSPQNGDNDLFAMSIIEVYMQNWEEAVKDICDLIGIVQQSEWLEIESKGVRAYSKSGYGNEGKYKYYVTAIPHNETFVSVMIRVSGEKEYLNDDFEFEVPDISNKTMAGMCTFMLFPNSDHEQWESEFWDVCEVLGVAIMSDWDEYETEYGLTYSKTGFDMKAETMYDIYMVPPIDEGDLCVVMVIKWTL